jgi:hypothetical protein
MLFSSFFSPPCHPPSCPLLITSLPEGLFLVVLGAELFLLLFLRNKFLSPKTLPDPICFLFCSSKTNPHPRTPCRRLFEFFSIRASNASPSGDSGREATRSSLVSRNDYLYPLSFFPSPLSPVFGPPSSILSPHRLYRKKPECVKIKPSGGRMFQTFEQARKYVTDDKIEMVDLKFCDL